MNQRDYEIRLIQDNFEVAVCYWSGENALSAIEEAMDVGMLPVPFGFIGYAVALRQDRVVFKIEIGFAD